MSDPQIEAAITKLEAMRLDELTDLYDPAKLAVLLSVKHANRAAFEKLFVKWKQMGFSGWHEIKVEIGKLEKKKLAGPGPSDGGLDPDTPLATARRFRDDMHPTLLWYQSEWLLHRGSHYVVVEPDKVKGDIYKFIDRVGGFSPNATAVSHVLDALKGEALAERGTFSPPCWLDEDELDYPAHEILACRNGLLHLSSGTLLDPTPRFFTRNGLPYAYDTGAPEPQRWLQFLNDVWGHDSEQITLLQEVMGYLLTPDTALQKFFLFLGPTRSGKGTITKVVTKLLGSTSVCSPTLGKFGERFGLEAALGKSLATVSDMRLSRRTDRQEIVGNLLRIVGEDDVDVERKHIGGAVTGKLSIRIMISSNLLPPLPDVSGALVARLITLTMKRSFLGEEDLTLDRKLEAELPGILNWAIEGWKRLKDQGHFTVTAESRETAAKIADLASPLSAFLRECCELDSNAMEPKGKVWHRFEKFVALNDLPPTYTSSNYFHRDLVTATQYRITESRPRVKGVQVPHWVGLRLIPAIGDDDEGDDE
ncbi:MAG: phage/plasmid primase, P4 family [Aliihoeflea sp.]